MKNKYFPNNFDAIAAAPDEFFESDLTFEEFYDWRVVRWEMPSSIHCILRAEHIKTGKVSEHVYQRKHAFEKRFSSYLYGGEHDITVVYHDQIAFLSPNYDPATD